MKKGLAPRFADFFFLLVFLSALATGPKMLNIDGDLPRHLLMGKIVLENGLPPTQELFSYMYEGRTYVPHEWLAGAIFFLAYLVLDLNGVVIIASLLIASTFTILYSWAEKQNGRILLNFLILFLGIVVTSIHWIARPHLFTMLFLALWLIWIERLYRGERIRLWIFPFLMLLWANLHAEFIAGFLILMAFGAGWVWEYLFTRSKTAIETGRKLLLVALSSFAASLFNPSGLRTWDIVLGYVNNRYLLSRISETRPPDFTQADYWPLLILLGVSIVLLITKRDKFAPAHFFLIAGFGAMSLLSARNAHLAGVVFPFVLSRAFAGIMGFQPLQTIDAMLRRMEGQVHRSLLPIVFTIVVSTLVIAGPLGRMNRFEPSVFPVEAVRWLQDHPQRGRMFNAFDWGGYILFHLWPEEQVFIESQTDVTGELTQKYEKVITLQDGWQNIFKQYAITWAILPPDWPLTRELIKQGWEIVSQDQTAVILAER